MTDFYFNIVQCYLDQEEPCDLTALSTMSACLLNVTFAPPKS